MPVLCVADPESVAALQKVNATSSSITVNWTAPLSGRFQGYQLGVKGVGTPVVLRPSVMSFIILPSWLSLYKSFAVDLA